MKVFITSDIEGTNGICAWEECEPDKRFYPFYTQKMTDEVNAVCKGINHADQTAEIFVKDAHHDARNLDHSQLPENVILNRGWGSSPLSMMLGVDGGFDAAMMTGYHSASSWGGNPLSHTMTSAVIYLKINGLVTSEFLLNYYTSLYYNVPVVMVSGDQMLCDFIKSFDDQILTVPTLAGTGGSTTSPHPAIALRRLEETAEKALEQRGKVRMELPKTFQTEVCYRNHQTAKRASNYPGAFLISDNTVGFDTDDYYAFLTYFMFTHP